MCKEEAVFGGECEGSSNEGEARGEQDHKLRNVTGVNKEFGERDGDDLQKLKRGGDDEGGTEVRGRGGVAEGRPGREGGEE